MSDKEKEDLSDDFVGRRRRNRRRGLQELYSKSNDEMNP